MQDKKYKKWRYYAVPKARAYKQKHGSIPFKIARRIISRAKWNVSVEPYMTVYYDPPVNTVFLHFRFATGEINLMFGKPKQKIDG